MTWVKNYVTASALVNNSKQFSPKSFSISHISVVIRGLCITMGAYMYLLTAGCVLSAAKAAASVKIAIEELTVRCNKSCSRMIREKYK
jgi:hypothetical protein